MYLFARTLINPFGGDDDEDFEMEYLIDRNFQVGYIMIRSDPDDEVDPDDIDNESDEFIPNKLSKNIKTLEIVECDGKSGKKNKKKKKDTK